MSDDTYDGAFPFLYHKDGNQVLDRCMSRLDWFAGQAIGAVVSRRGITDRTEVARDCYYLAAAMIAESERQNK